MDGGRRLLQSLGAALSSGFVRPLALKRGGELAIAAPVPVQRASLPARRAPLRVRERPLRGKARLLAMVTRTGFGSLLAVLFLGLSAGYAFVRGGHYESLVAETGGPANGLARLAGFSVEAITITGQRELTYGEVLAAAGLRSSDSTLFLDAAAVRKRIEAMPFVQQASVRKLFPNQLVIALKEAEAHALWQVGGEVSVIAADGRVIDRMRDQRFVHLPFVAGDGANKRTGEYAKLLEAAGDMRRHIRAGVLVGERRWTLKLANGVDVKLPEHDPEKAVAWLARMARDNKLIEKDVIAIDMRAPGRISVRLTEDAAARRAEEKGKKPRVKGGPA